MRLPPAPGWSISLPLGAVRIGEADWEWGNEMAEKFMAALRNSNQIDITVTGRSTGRRITLPVWFVEDEGELFLVPVTGSDSDWYKNVRATPRMQLTADGVTSSVPATPIADPGRVRAIVGKFREKYGADQIASYYPKTDVAVEVSLPKDGS